MCDTGKSNPPEGDPEKAIPPIVVEFSLQANTAAPCSLSPHLSMVLVSNFTVGDGSAFKRYSVVASGRRRPRTTWQTHSAKEASPKMMSSQRCNTLVNHVSKYISRMSYTLAFARKQKMVYFVPCAHTGHDTPALMVFNLAAIKMIWPSLASIAIGSCNADTPCGTCCVFRKSVCTLPDRVGHDKLTR